MQKFEIAKVCFFSFIYIYIHVFGWSFGQVSIGLVGCICSVFGWICIEIGWVSCAAFLTFIVCYITEIHFKLKVDIEYRIRGQLSSSIIKVLMHQKFQCFYPSIPEIIHTQSQNTSVLRIHQTKATISSVWDLSENILDWDCNNL